MPIVLLLVGAVVVTFLLKSGQARGSRIPQATLGLPVGGAGARVAVLGDSYAAGLGPELAKLAAGANVAYQFEGHVGTTPRQWATHAAACGTCGDWLKAFNPTHVVVSLGTNDVGLQSPASQLPHYKTLIDAIQVLPAHVVWLQPPRIGNPGIGRVRAVIDGLLVDVFHSENLTLPMAPDGLHPTSQGYATWAQAIWDWLTGAARISDAERAAAEVRAQSAA